MAGFFISSTAGVIARIDATVAFVAEALAAFGDTDSLEQRRVKAVLVLCNPTRAVELLAAYAAFRAGTDQEPEPDPDPGPDTDSGGDALARMDAFARRVGFAPRRLPWWLNQPRSERPQFVFDWSRLLPPLTLHLHLSAETLAAGEGGVVRWEGEGPVTEQFVHDQLRPLHDYRIQPVIDLAGMPPTDGYEVPDRHRTAVTLRSPADVSPFAASVNSKCDADHTIPYDPNGPPGQTRLDNLAPLGRFAHRVKTHGNWTMRQPFDGIVLWRDPHGQIYLVDHTGTHKITRPGQPAGAARDHDPDITIAGNAQVITLEFDPTR